MRSLTLPASSRIVAQEHAKRRSEAELRERQINAAAGAGMEAIGSVVEHPFAVQAEGTRYTATVLPGTEGNDQPFDIVLEKWSSPELKMVVMMKRSDARTGDSLYRLTGINRGEPDHALFEAPSDFTVVEEGQAGKAEAKQR